MRRHLSPRLPTALAAATLIVACHGALAEPLSVAAPQPTPPSVPPGPPSAIDITLDADRTRVLRGGDGAVNLRLSVSAPASPSDRSRLPTDLVVVLDKSGSMEGDKIRFAKDATVALLDLLGPQDRFGLVAYDDDAHVLRGLAPVGADLGALAHTIRSVRADGSTNMSEGLDRGAALLDGAAQVGRGRRVVLLSDGLPNRGDPSPAGLIARARAVVGREAAVTAVGVGADWDEQLMAQLADAGTGNLHYLQNGTSLAEVFAHELDDASSIVATNLRVEITMPTGVELVSAGGYPLDRSGAAITLDLGPVSAGRTRSVWLSVRVPDAEAEVANLGDVQVRWSDAEGRAHNRAIAAPSVTREADPQRAWASVQKDRWEGAVVKEKWGAVQQEVAKAVQRGDLQGAKQVIETYSDEIGAANAHVGSEEVAKNLEDAKALERQVESTFVGENQEQRQRELSKGAQTTGYGSRRGKGAIVKQ